MANETPGKVTTPFTAQTPVKVPVQTLAPVQAQGQGQFSVDNLMETISKFVQSQVELITNGIKSATDVIEPVGKAAIELTVNVLNAVNQILQNVSASIAPKQ
jgi:chlorosome envelope protein B